MKLRGWRRWMIGAIAGVAVLVVGGPFVYIHFIEGKAPPPLSVVSSGPTTASSSGESVAASGSVDGTWKVAAGSQAGYRVKEILFGQSNVAVGRTSSIRGSITIAGTSVTAGSLTVDMASISSDQSRRDNQFRGRIMETSTYPTATFELTSPVDIGTIPADGVQKSAQATGKLTLHGTTRSVTFTVTGKRTGATFQVSGAIPITFADYSIQNPSFGGTVKTEDHGTMEFLLVFAKA